MSPTLCVEKEIKYALTMILYVDITKTQDVEMILHHTKMISTCQTKSSKTSDIIYLGSGMEERLEIEI